MTNIYYLTVSVGQMCLAGGFVLRVGLRLQSRCPPGPWSHPGSPGEELPPRSSHGCPRASGPLWLLAAESASWHLSLFTELLTTGRLAPLERWIREGRGQEEGEVVTAEPRGGWARQAGSSQNLTSEVPPRRSCHVLFVRTVHQVQPTPQGRLYRGVATRRAC